MRLCIQTQRVCQHTLIKGASLDCCFGMWYDLVSKAGGVRQGCIQAQIFSKARALARAVTGEEVSLSIMSSMHHAAWCCHAPLGAMGHHDIAELSEGGLQARQSFRSRCSNAVACRYTHLRPCRASWRQHYLLKVHREPFRSPDAGARSTARPVAGRPAAGAVDVLSSRQPVLTSGEIAGGMPPSSPSLRPLSTLWCDFAALGSAGARPSWSHLVLELM